MSDVAPPKFVTEGGVRKLNPAWKQWKASGGAAGAGGTPAAPSVVPTMKNEMTALPIITSYQDQQAHLSADTQVASSYQQTMQKMQDASVAQQIGLAPDQAMNRLASCCAKYEIPQGMLSKLFDLANFQVVEMIVDDSGSMRAATDSKDASGRTMSRWQEVHQRLGQMFEIYAYVPNAPTCYIRFLNRTTVIEVKHHAGEPPEAFLQRVSQIFLQEWQTLPSGTTPAKERISESLSRYTGQKALRYFFGDGVPNGGEDAQEAITDMLVKRSKPQENPFTFMSCTNNDSDVEWMKDAEEKAPFCAEFDDYADEADEILKDQGKAFPYGAGAHLVGQWCAAFNPHDLDAMDEGAPLTKPTLDSLQGYICSDAEYKYYFDEFLAAGMRRPAIEKTDKIKREHLDVWRNSFEQFRTATSGADIPKVVEYRKQILDASKSSCVIC